MGCDIHAFIQYKDVNGMLHVERRDIDRNYTLFAVLAGVRNDCGLPVVVEPRYEWPTPRAQELVDYEEGWNGDLHTFSWLTLDECKRALGIYYVNNHEGFRRSYDLEDVIKRMEWLTARGCEPLFVFAFDN